MSDPRIPRPSDTWATGGGTPPGTAGPPSQDPLEVMLDAFARSTDLQPAPDLAGRIHAAVAREPARTPPRRYLAALITLRPTAMRDAFRLLAAAAVGRGRFPAVVRAQALALVALTVGAIGLAAVGGAIGITRIVDAIDHDRHPHGPLLVSPSPAPTPRSTPAPTPQISPTAAPPTDAPTTPPRATDRPDETRSPSQTRKPSPTKKPTATKKPTQTKRPGGGDARETEEPDDRDDKDDRDDGADPDGGGGRVDRATAR